MADNGPANPQPNPNEPWLEALTFEQIAQLVNEVGPEVFYQRASAFDQAGARLQDVLDQVRHEMNLVREAWTGTASDDFAALVRDVTAKVSGVLQFLQSPGYGATLRDAGDRLADHQRRLRDLAGQKAQQESTPPAPGAPSPEQVAQANDDSAKQILRDLRTAYWDVGNALPGFPYKPPAKEISDPNAVNPNGVNGQNEGGGGNASWTGNPGPVSNAYAVTGPPGSRTNNNAFVKSAHPGPSSDQYTVDGGRGSHDEQVLGRHDPNGQSGPGMPGWPGRGSTYFAGGPTDVGDPVLGHRSATRRPETCAVDGAAGEPFAAVPNAVLGRAVPSGTPKIAAARKRVVEEREPEFRPATEASTTDAVSADSPSVRIRTAADVPVPAVTIENAPATVPAGLAVKPDGTPVTPSDVTPTVSLASEVDPVKPVMLTASHGSGGVTHAVALDPVRRGLFAPGTTTADALAGQVPPGTPTVPAGSQTTHADPNGTSGHMGGMPMSPMMLGGMAGGGQQQGGRMAAMPNEPRPDVWDPATVAPVAVGRRAQEQQDEQEEREPARHLSKEEVQAALAEKFAELDRLSGRGRDGGK